MTSRLFSLLPWCAAFLIAASAQAQVVRPSESIYILLRGAVAGYYGDLDGNSDGDAGSANPRLGDGFDQPGYGAGAELGYHFNPNLSFGLGFIYQDLSNLDTEGRGRNGTDVLSVPGATRGTRIGVTKNNGSVAVQAQALFRYLPFDAARISPFLEFGGALVFGTGTEGERAGCVGQTGQAFEDCNSAVLGYGPVGGLGLDVALTPQLGLFLNAQSTVVFPDVALDGADVSSFNIPRIGDDAGFDIVANLGGGLRYALSAPYTPVRIQGLECPAELETGENGSFMVITNQNATPTVSSTWQFGDGGSGSGTSTSHAFTAPGTYTVTSMVSNVGGTDSESCIVTVVSRPTPPSLAGCRATPSRVDAGQQVTIDATATGADDVRVDFGDGTTASSLPARHAYANTGSYTVTITATNEYGTDTCTIPVTIGDSYCADITELNPVFYGYGATTLTADATARLDENIEILRRCPDICVTINGYSDGSEPGDAMRISQARADAAMQYYVGQGIDASRLRAVGRGVDPDANSKEDPGPGDSRARRADSIPSSCAGF